MVSDATLETISRVRHPHDLIQFGLSPREVDFTSRYFPQSHLQSQVLGRCLLFFSVSTLRMTVILPNLCPVKSLYLPFDFSTVKHPQERVGLALVVSEVPLTSRVFPQSHLQIQYLNFWLPTYLGSASPITVSFPNFLPVKSAYTTHHPFSNISRYAFFVKIFTDFTRFSYAAFAIIRGNTLPCALVVCFTIAIYRSSALSAWVKFTTL